MMQTLPLFTAYALTNTSYSVGAHGEIIAATLLENSGYDVATKGTQHTGHDLVAISHDTGESFRVEVKAARRNSRGQWCFTLQKHDRYGHANHLHSDVLLLLAALKVGTVVPFVIPVERVRSKRAITIPSHPRDYSGKYARYRQSPHDLTLEGVPCR